MKNLAYIGCLFLLSISSEVTAQKGKLSVGYRAMDENQIDHVLIIYSNDKCNKGLLVENDTSDFVLRGRVFDEMRNEYIIFTSYSEPVGCTFYYLFNEDAKAFYVSQAVQEWEVPFLFSFDRSTLSMNLVSYDPSECGKIKKLPFNEEMMKEYDLDFIKELKSFITIDL